VQSHGKRHAFLAEFDARKLHNGLRTELTPRRAGTAATSREQLTAETEAVISANFMHQLIQVNVGGRAIAVSVHGIQMIPLRRQSNNE
jgi:hypothetical protein